MGLVGAAFGALLWVGARRLTGHEIAVGALAVGFFAGFAVRKGSKGQGGARYQALAVFLAYTGFALNYALDIVPLVMKTAGQGSKTAAVATGLGLSFAMPMVAATRNIHGLLTHPNPHYEARRFTRRAPPEQTPSDGSAPFADSAPTA